MLGPEWIPFLNQHHGYWREAAASFAESRNSGPAQRLAGEDADAVGPVEIVVETANSCADSDLGHDSGESGVESMELGVSTE
jgi:hypothetical protein